jgi:beta-glucosidase
MTRAQKAEQMVMANNPPITIFTANSPGAVFTPAGWLPPTGRDITAWAQFTDEYAAALPQTSLQIPILFGLDAVHGMNAATGTVIFPQNAGLASSRNADMVFRVGQIEASEILAGGVNWTFAPFAGATWDYRWGRVYESYSDDPTWAGEMLTAQIQGMQGVGGLGSSTSMMACAKHVAGDGQMEPPSHKGAIVDRGSINIDAQQMETWGLAQFVPAIAAGLGCVMVSDGWWNGTSLTYGASGATLLGLLKGKYGFKGFVVTDYDAANGFEVEAINNGVDMLMAPTDPWTTAIAKIEGSQALSQARMDDAVTRILNAKCQAGLFQLPGGPPPYQRDPSLITSVGSDAHRAVGRQAVQQSLVLLQNNASALPISKTANVYIAGSGANSLTNQCGGYTIAWQGNGAATTGTTIQQAIAKVRAPVATMDQADVVIIVLSETPYAEGTGDSPTLDTLWKDTAPPGADFTLLQQARASGKPVVAIILSGRPVLINSPNHPDALSDADAWVAAWLPGTEGDGVADVLFGDVPFTGKLSHSWPANDGEVNVMCGTGYGGITCDGGYQPLFSLGFGLTYGASDAGTMTSPSDAGPGDAQQSSD